MTEFMCDDAFQLGWSQPVTNAFRQQHDRGKHQPRRISRGGRVILKAT
jgi:hypothetical protein